MLHGVYLFAPMPNGHTGRFFFFFRGGCWFAKARNMVKSRKRSGKQASRSVDVAALTARATPSDVQEAVMESLTGKGWR